MAYTTLQSVTHSGISIVTASDVALNDSSKILLITDFDEGAFVEILAIRVELTATATVGTRLLEVRLEAITGPDILYELEIANNDIAASASRTWVFAPAVNEAITTPQQIQMPPGVLFVFAGQQLVIEDQAAIDAAADDMIVHVMGKLSGVRSL